VEEEQRKAVEERIAAASSGKVLEDLTFDKMQQIRSFYTQVRAQPHQRPACATTDFPFAKSPPPPPLSPLFLQDEMAAFKKPSKKKLVKRRRGSLAEELEATAGGAAGEGGGGADHGSRSSKPEAVSTARHVWRPFVFDSLWLCVTHGLRCWVLVRDVLLQDLLEGRERYERALAAAQLQSVQLLSGGGDDQVPSSSLSPFTPAMIKIIPLLPPLRVSIMTTDTTLKKLWHARVRL